MPSRLMRHEGCFSFRHLLIAFPGCCCCCCDSRRQPARRWRCQPGIFDIVWKRTGHFLHHVRQKLFTLPSIHTIHGTISGSPSKRRFAGTVVCFILYSEFVNRHIFQTSWCDIDRLPWLHACPIDFALSYSKNKRCEAFCWKWCILCT